MYAMRLWSVRHARLLESIYNAFEPLLVKVLHPLCVKIGYDRVEKPVTVVEKAVKGFLFDCRMCGQCVLSSTGMACPMNCPKNLRNGPCGGVRPNGNCEVEPEMRCVWVEAAEGSQRMKNSVAIELVQKPVNANDQGSSSWLRVAQQKRDERFYARANHDLRR